MLAIDHLYNYCLGKRRPSGDGRSVICIYDFSVSDKQKAVFLSPFRTVLCAIHVQVTDRPSPDAPSLTQTIIVQMVYYSVNVPLGPVELYILACA